jgi:hypothetical protein
MDKLKFDAVGTMSRFGVFKDFEGNLLAPTTNIEGIEVGNGMLANWIWQGCKYMREEYDKHHYGERAYYLKETITNALTIHYKLLKFADDEVQEHIDRFINGD